MVETGNRRTASVRVVEQQLAEFSSVGLAID